MTADVREVDAVIIMDRSVDLLTPFVTQLTYQGIIDENIGIEINKVIIDKKIPFPKDEDGPQDGNANMNLYLTDPIFDAIKDLRIAEAGKLLREKPAGGEPEKEAEKKKLEDEQEANSLPTAIYQDEQGRIRDKEGNILNLLVTPG